MQAEVEEIIGIIQHVHQKVRQMIESTRLTNLKHISSKLVEILKKMEAKVRDEAEWIVKIFQDFQSKVVTTKVSN